MSETLEIGSIKPRIRYTGDGETTEFSFGFTIFSTDDIDVYIDDLLLTSGYLVNKEAKGGIVVFDTAPTKNKIITIYRNLEFKRTTNFQEVGPFRTSKVNLEFDYQLACMEQLQDTINRTVTFPPYTSTQLDVFLPFPQPGKAIVWNEDGTSLKNSVIEIEKLAQCYVDILQKAKEVNNDKLETAIKSKIASEAAATAVEKTEFICNRPETIYTQQKNCGSVSGNISITIEPGIFEYLAAPTANTNFSFEFDKCNTDMIISFSLLLNQNSGVFTYSYTFPGTRSFKWLDGLAASPSGLYLLTFRRYPDGHVVGVANGIIAS